MYEHVGEWKLPSDVAISPSALIHVFEMDWQSSGYGYGLGDKTLLEVMHNSAGLSAFGDLRVVMLVVIKPNGFIRLHRDEPLTDGVKRWHFVLQTNPHCWNIHAGIPQRLDQDGIYEIDPTAEHASVNFGDTERIHLVVDLVPTHVFISVQETAYVEV